MLLRGYFFLDYNFYSILSHIYWDVSHIIVMMKVVYHKVTKRCFFFFFIFYFLFFYFFNFFLFIFFYWTLRWNSLVKIRFCLIFGSTMMLDFSGHEFKVNYKQIRSARDGLPGKSVSVLRILFWFFQGKPIVYSDNQGCRRNITWSTSLVCEPKPYQNHSCTFYDPKKGFCFDLTKLGVHNVKVNIISCYSGSIISRLL